VFQYDNKILSEYKTVRKVSILKNFVIGRYDHRHFLKMFIDSETLVLLCEDIREALCRLQKFVIWDTRQESLKSYRDKFRLSLTETECYLKKFSLEYETM
jgi:hypothetical protein